ncbi:MAG: hypothetical protein CMI32_04220 [Opitutales bacterium]|nr:hypothetical protein [Opitutales bacterium]
MIEIVPRLVTCAAKAIAKEIAPTFVARPVTLAAKATVPTFVARLMTAKAAIEGDAPMAVANNGLSKNWNVGMP